MAALVGIASDFRAVLAAHISFQFMDRRCLRSPHDVEGNGLMRVAAKAFHFQIAEPGIDRVAQRRRWLRRTLKAEHALVPRLAGEPVGFLAGFRWPAPPPPGPMSRKCLSRFRAHAGRIAGPRGDGKPLQLAVDNSPGTTERRAGQSCSLTVAHRACRPLLADVGNLGAHLEHDPLDAAPDRKIATRRAPRRQARHAVRVTPAMPSISASTSARRTSSRFFSISRSCSISVLTATWAASASARGDCCRSRRKYRKVGNAALVEREAVTLPLDYAFGFEFADVGPGAIEV